MANMSDVAKAAGVSKSTVSNVFSGKRAISEAVRMRVLAAAEQLNYRPNYFARSMVTKETRIIGVVMDSEKVKFSQYNISFFNGVLKECNRQGYRLLIDTLHKEYRKQVTQMTSEPVDGEIILDPARVDERIQERVANGRVMTIIGKPPLKYETALSYVNNDNVQAAETATAYLLGLGHRHILLMNAVKKRTVSQDRKAGYVQAFEKIGLTANENCNVYRGETVSSVEYGYITAKKYLRKNPMITAIIADTDQIALGVYRAVSELGLSVPGDVSVIAFNNNTVYPDEFNPPLTCIELNGEILGQEATKLLIEQLQSKEKLVKQIIIQSKLVERASCGPARTIFPSDPVQSSTLVQREDK
ncbi:LacI family DNA-binding transcriptional regulator [Paenibacillus fonticola]|uniref:LacI family DNA-binding transcriptional regulator n=1 Tax=Paenibacillus fonticola TaxID=379896 RepID=UPI0003746A68|nr:LacI family DNA-binding transcriptional regulator [Paenibacillus fonticola]